VHKRVRDKLTCPKCASANEHCSKLGHDITNCYDVSKVTKLVEK
jgi:hypothetical protein